jgi:hypothetical protein
MLERNGHGCLRADAGEVCRGKNRKRQAGVHTEGNMPPACRGAGSQSPWSSNAGGSRKLRETNRRPMWRATVPYRARLLATVPYRARFAWARCAWMCPASRRQCAFVVRTVGVEDSPLSIQRSRNAGGVRRRSEEREGLHSRENGNPLGWLARRRIASGRGLGRSGN